MAIKQSHLTRFRGVQQTIMPNFLYYQSYLLQFFLLLLWFDLFCGFQRPPSFSCRQTTTRHTAVVSSFSTKEPLVEVVENDDEDDHDRDWTPDREIARRQRMNARMHAEKVSSASPSPYTAEEEEIITESSKREEGYLGDSTLVEISQDYSVPICYLADVLCMWGVPVPIDIHQRLGDLVTGEQAFAILEAVNSLDIGDLQDRYSNMSLLELCDYWDVDLQTAFEFAVKEGWSLPFGVQTFLRTEQEEELLRVHGAI